MITFLFGSGADTDANKDLLSGQSFAASLIGENYKEEIQSLLGAGFARKKIIYPTSSKVFIQTVVSFPEKAKGILDDSDIQNCVNYYLDKSSVKYDEVIKVICKRWYNAITSNDEKDKDVKDYFLTNAVFFDFLDEKFNSLRYQQYNDNAKRVIIAYTTIYILMLKSLYNLNSFDWKFENVFDKLKAEYDVQCESDCYYHLLKEIVEEKKFKYKVVTTNYTELAEKETGKETIYLHGKMTWFEDLKNLSVYDCTDDNDRAHLLEAERIIPFILIPSGVKPLICTKQIKQFSHFIYALEESDELCVVGYKFNSEDNHINSIISDWLQQPNKRLICFNFNKDIDFSKQEWADQFSEKIIEYNSKKHLDLSEEKIQNIIINKVNSHEAFSEYLVNRGE